MIPASGALAEDLGPLSAVPAPPVRRPASLPEDRQPVIIAALRTPVCRAHGALKTLHAHELLAPVLRGLLADTGVAPDQVSDVVIGNAVGGGGNVARLAALEAGLPVGVPGADGGPAVRFRAGRDCAGVPAGRRRRQFWRRPGRRTSTSPAGWRASVPRRSVPGPEPTANRSSSAAPGSPPTATETRTWAWPRKTWPSAMAFRGSGRTTLPCAATAGPWTRRRPEPSTPR